MDLLGSDSQKLKQGAKISDNEFRKFAEFIYALLGIFIPPKRRYLLENHLGVRLSVLGLDSFTQYLDYLCHAPGRKQELNKFIEKVTTHETSFYRDITQLDNFREKVLAPLLAKKSKAGTKKLRIWSAGCSTGEEPYTLAIMVADMLGTGISQWNVSITATDISTAVLEKARKGVYGKRCFQTMPNAVPDRFFIEDGPRYQVRSCVREQVKFEQLNLNDQEAMKQVVSSDIIFCRNVIIYFDDAMKRRLAQSFHDNLVPGGFLLLGHSENLYNISRTFIPVPGMESPVYKKGGRRESFG